MMLAYKYAPPLIRLQQFPDCGAADAEKERNIKKLLSRLWVEQEGQDLAEYVLLLALLVLGAITTIHGIANTINAMFLNAASNIGNTTGG
jgi:Flp pilus assembly pilin Flp